MFGIDISNHQHGIDLSKEPVDFVIMKATEGISFVDKSFDSHLEQSTKLDKLIGCYHFARPDLRPNVEGMEAEAKWFVNNMRRRNLIGKAILVLDWEKQPFSEDLMRVWLEVVKKETGVTPVIYGSRSKLTRYCPNLITEYPLWLALWPTGREIKFYQSPKYVDKFMPSNGIIPWTIWQYTSNGRIEGYNGAVDLDFANISKSMWRQLAGDYEIISNDMQWAIDAGLFKGYPDGTFGPKDPLTREQAATVLRRLFTYLYTEGAKIKEGIK